MSKIELTGTHMNKFYTYRKLSSEIYCFNASAENKNIWLCSKLKCYKKCPLAEEKYHQGTLFSLPLSLKDCIYFIFVSFSLEQTYRF